MKFPILSLATALLIAPVITSCGSDEPFEDSFKPNPNNPSGGGGTDNPSGGGGTDNPSGGGGTSSSSYNELYRPQIHYTPAKNWVNDPNGMVYIDGTWHLFYQYNPYGNGWGNMSWGHATSTDLVHWTEQPTALVPDALGDIFSGSAVYDADNTGGFGKGAMVAFYTAAGAHQQQALAYSTDGGKTFTKYDGNPIIANTTRGDFRDPKVFWHAETKRWVMSLALGWEYGIQFWTSTDLRTWREASTFTTEVGRCKRGQWECPDLLRMNYNGQEKWVLIVSVNPGGPVIGSGTMYFVGNFDGEKFTADDLGYPLWLDYGLDNYAGVTWSNTPDGRIILIGWMNNWSYSGDVPCDPWRSAFTLPRELSLVDYQGKPVLASRPVKELDKLASDWSTLAPWAIARKRPTKSPIAHRQAVSSLVATAKQEQPHSMVATPSLRFPVRFAARAMIWFSTFTSISPLSKSSQAMARWQLPTSCSQPPSTTRLLSVNPPRRFVIRRTLPYGSKVKRS